jgi:hypothetical protein
MYKLVNSPEEVKVGRNQHPNGEYDYIEWVSVHTNRNVAGMNVKVGLQPVLASASHRVRAIFDIYAGIGIRYRWYTQTNIALGPTDYIEQNNSDWLGIRTTSFYPTIVGGFRVGVCF